MFNRWIVKLLDFFPKDLVWVFSKRYIAGKELKNAIEVTKNLNKQKIKATMDLLGEFQTRDEMVAYYKEEYMRLIDESAAKNLDNSFSVKPTMFSLLSNEEQCFGHIRDIVSKAASYGRFVRIDMEDTQCTDRELAMYKRLLNEFPGHVGIVLQAYLKRTMSDLKDLKEFDNGRGLINIRICKGIYNEPAELAFKNKGEINRNYLEDLDYMLSNNMYAAIATHDKKLITAALSMISEKKIDRSKYEFQMLYGVTPDLRRSVVEKGHTMRVYVPYGKDWYNYSTRRLRENPQMVSHIIKALVVRG
ncbi:MAG TPA: proline dehydrogenase family protein [Bacteroidales bacterium]|nr:proline dehydrogenase family protein [Bacteroidales bacterium]